LYKSSSFHPDSIFPKPTAAVHLQEVSADIIGGGGGDLHCSEDP
jgi:hypothetical protein